MNFFLYLEKERPDLLNFRASGDKWQIVHAWLLRERRVKDKGPENQPRERVGLWRQLLGSIKWLNQKRVTVPRGGLLLSAP
jgi:hypothetical protein